MKKKSNNLIKTICFIIIFAILCLAYFGLGGTDRTSVEYVQFSCVVFSMIGLYLAVMLSGKVKNSSALVSDAALYLIASTFLNFVIKLEIMKDLVIWNIIVFLVFILIVIIDTFVNKGRR